MPFQFERLAIPDLILVHARHSADSRGLFLETYKHSAFAANGIAERFVQDNQSRSMRGVLRGLHFQKPPQAQGKLVRVLRGEVYDVAVDIRRGSPTFGQWLGVQLSEERFEMLYVPPGFAHGFCALSELVDLAYKVTAEYAPQLEAGIVWNDPQIGIAWPIADPILSSRDAALPTLADADLGFVYAADPQA
ncbi:MAG: dTDP-4-dehydrorhamnose 3,5-epimerase [Anaerolineae bacterium]|nr:dTDP-4-dehydrorhamnose 3,5-epimerase [Anaerolineae bacterium]